MSNVEITKPHAFKKLFEQVHFSSSDLKGKELIEVETKLDNVFIVYDSMKLMENKGLSNNENTFIKVAYLCGFLFYKE